MIDNLIVELSYRDERVLLTRLVMFGLCLLGAGGFIMFIG